jgi:hypothetical protein
MKRTHAIPLLSLAFSFTVFATGASGAYQGTLVAMGGGNGTPEIFEKWKSLGGGQNARVVLIPTANNPGDDVTPVINGLKQVFGVPEISVLDKDKGSLLQRRNKLG